MYGMPLRAQEVDDARGDLIDDRQLLRRRVGGAWK